MPLARPFAFLATLLITTLLALLPTVASAAPPDPLVRGAFATETLDPFTAGTVELQEPNSAGGAPTGGNAAATLQVRGVAYSPVGRTTPSPVLVLVHGNHGSCDAGAAPNCAIFNRNDRGYGYLGENLASQGYTVVSIDQDQLIFYQDGTSGKGMHQRRLLIAAVLDQMYKANQQALDPADSSVGDRFVGKLDMSRIGLMGHSRGGDAVASFIDYNRTRPAPGRRYDLRGVISLAPVDYERKAPYGTAFLSILPYCDSDVSNLQGARFFERSQYISPGDPFPRIQQSVLGGNHNRFNSVWDADDKITGGDDAPGDAACDATGPTSVRLSAGGYLDQTSRPAGSNPAGIENDFSGDPALMGDQARIGLATMSAFFRRYVGDEAAFAPYETGELSEQPDHQQLPQSACPVASGPMACEDRLMTSYFAPPAERRDVLRPEPDDPLGTSAVGTAITASGFANPYLEGGGILPRPAKTESGVDWCNPEPDDFTPSVVGNPNYPTAEKGCPLPATQDLGGQSGTRENAPINHSYGLQLALAWAQPATIATRIPAADGDVSALKSLSLGAAVNFFDPRNPARTAEALYNPAATTQDFTIALTDAAGKEATVSAADPRYGNALQQTTGSTTSKTHVVLNQVRVPLADFAAQGLDLKAVRRVELRFGGAGKPASGSVQVADVRFQEAVVAARTLPDPMTLIAATPREPASAALPDVVGVSPSTVPARATARSSVATAADCSSKPSGRLTQRSGRKGRLRLRGTARSSCGTVRSVQVLVSRKAGERCRFLGSKGRLGKPLPCSSRLGLVAAGTRSWKLTARAPKGRYRLVVRTVDTSGRVAQSSPRAVRVR